jgi:hypothetical protein
MDLIKKSFSNSWTGGASIDPSTGLQGAPNRFHGPGAFDNFKMADLFDNDRWTREKIGDPNPRSDRQRYTSYYSPRDITETRTIGPGGEETTKIVSKLTPDKTSLSFDERSISDGRPYERQRDHYQGNTGYTPEWASQARVPMNDNPPIMGPWQKYPPLEPGQGHPLGNPFGYPERTATKGPPRYTDVSREMPGATRMFPPQHSPFRAQSRGVYHDEMPGSTRQQMAMPPYSPHQIGTPMLPRGSWDRRARAQEQAIESGQRPYSYNMPQAEPYRSTPTRPGWNPGNLYDQARGDVNTEGKLLARMLGPTYTTLGQGDTIPVNVKRKMIEYLLQGSD